MNSKKVEEIFARIKIVGIEDIVFSALFIVLLFIPIAEDISQSSLISTEEFIGKEQMLSAVNNFKYQVLKDRVFNGVITDQNGWMVYTAENSLDDYQNTNQFTNEELRKVKARLNHLCSSMAKNGIKLIILVPPNKNTIYPEYMPAEIAPVNNKSRLDQVMSVWKDSEDCKMIDLRSEFLEAKKNNKMYNSTDTHWTHMGAFLAYQQVSQVMKEDFPAVKVRPLSDFQTETSTFIGDLKSRFGHFDISEETVRLKPSFQPDYILRNFESTQAIRNFTQSFSNNTDLPVAIIYRDSFFSSLFQFISENFREADYFWSYDIDLDRVKMKKPDYLILEVTERYLGSAIFRIPEPKQ